MASSCKKESELEKDKNDIKAYLQANGIEAQMKQNVYYVVMEEGTGLLCEPGDVVACKYTSWPIDDPDKVIETTGDRRALEVSLPSVVPNSSYGNMAGLQIALVGMREGGRLMCYVPASLAYKASDVDGQAFGNIRLEVELCKVHKE